MINFNPGTVYVYNQDGTPTRCAVYISNPDGTSTERLDINECSIECEDEILSNSKLIIQSKHRLR